MPHHHVQQARNVGPNLFACNENSAYIMPHVTARAVMSCIMRCMHAGRPAALCIHGMPGITYGCAISTS